MLGSAAGRPQQELSHAGVRYGIQSQTRPTSSSTLHQWPISLLPRGCHQWSACRMSGTYNYCLVLLSLLFAVVVSHTALRLAAREARAKGSSVQLWLAGFATAMGTVILSIHTIGVQPT